ncbi:MAG: acetyl-CoA carboxylase biotin carboxyl carrier protein [Polynucleobacter sp.]|nr:acetyl-CoA carboxylase biotin carboxyl carrier protein [Polynucleobacter sp.]
MTKSAAKRPAKNASPSAAAADQNASFGMKEVKELISLIKDSGNFNTFAYKTDAFEIEINVGNGSIPAVAPAPQAQPLERVAPIAPPPISPVPNSQASQASQAPQALTLAPNQRWVTSPMVGTFFRRPNPTSPPFVEVGDEVQPDTSVCIVEVMKLLNTIEAGCVGHVVSILVEDGAPIESGQPLMILELK